MPPENVQVAVLVRPFTDREKEQNCTCIVEAKQGDVKVFNTESDKAKDFKFDYSCWSVEENNSDYTSRNHGVEELGSLVLSCGFDGYNVCVFTYGASESGKSCAMFGTEAGPGLIPSICTELFERATMYDDDTSCRAEISFLEIHKEFVKDLLGKRRNWHDSLRVREHRELGVYVDKLTKHIVTDASEAESLISKGLKNRSVCSRSSNNLHSSSHTIFTIKFIQARLEDGIPSEVISTIQLVDLAGSRSPHEECINGHSETEENDLSAYDQSLLTLDQVISTLSSKATRNSDDEPPYRDSALTWILKDCFGGNCKTIMLAAVSPANICHNETLSTMRYANQVHTVVNHPDINEDGHVKLIKELKVEIQCLRNMLQEDGRGKDNMDKQKAERKLHENEELMKRLTGIWEDKWSKAQKLIEERSLEVTELGSALKFETEEPHLVSLGGGRLSIGVTICPIRRGKTVVGVPTDQSKPDIELRGRGIENEHCVVEYNGEVVVLHPKAPYCSVDGIPITEPTKLPQGCMLCLGKSNYFRFNHPKEAKRIREANPGNRFSIVPDGYFPDVELAIEQYKRDKQERERLKKENVRLLALEQEYKGAVDRIEHEKAQLEDERCQLLELERLQRDAATHFENEIASQIKELEHQKEELRQFEEERVRLDMSAEQFEEDVRKQEQARSSKEENRKRAYERLQQKQAHLESIQEEDCSDRMVVELELEEERQRLALLELDCLVEEVSENEKEHQNMILLDEEREKLDEMKERQNEVIRQLEEELNAQIVMLKEERRRENEKIEKEKERIRTLEEQQEKALELINVERMRLEEEKQEEKKRIEAEKEKMYQMENERLQALEKIAKDQEKERSLIREEKERLMELEKKHENSMKELEDSMISKQEKIERERQIEFEFFETEQLLLEELEQKQREAAEQLERERKAMQEGLDREREAERKKIQMERKRLEEMQQQQQEVLKQAEEERTKLRAQLKSERELMHKEKSRLLKLQHECKQIRNKGVDSSGADLVLALTNRNLTRKDCTPEERKKLLQEEKRRLLELKKEAEAVLVSKTKKQNGERSSMSSSSSGEDFENASVKSTDSSLKSSDSQPLVEELERERQKRRQLESLLEQERGRNRVNGEIPADKVKDLEKALNVERMRRQEMEKALHEKQKQDELDRLAAEERSRKEMLTDKAIQDRLPAQVKSPVKDALNLAHHIVSVGHVLENCPSAKVTSTICKGYLSKMGGKVRRTWKKRWFVFDRQRKALMYFHDEHKKEPKGIIYFQAIQDVYAASWCSNKGPSPRTTFIIKTPQKSYYVAAPSGLAMSIWIDVILTGREGGFYNFQ